MRGGRLRLARRLSRPTALGLPAGGRRLVASGPRLLARGLALLACGLALAAWASAARAEERSERLEKLRRAIAESRERVARFEHDQRGLLDTIESVDRATAELESEAARRAREVEEARAARRAAEQRLPALETGLERTRRVMASRVVALYKTGDLGPAQVLFASTSLRQLLERVRILSLLLRHDRRLVERWRAQVAAVEDARSEAEETAARETRAIAELAQRREQLTEERASKQRLLASVRSDRARERAALAELETAATALEETIARLGESPEPLTRPAGPPFASLRGKLPPPVAAPIVVGFGKQVDAQFLTEIFRKGVDFGAPRGTPVHAVAAGVVRFAGWFRGYGRMVIVDHGDGFHTVHGHLDRVRVSVGEPVAAGDELGTVGDTGSLSGPRLYFEIREGGRALDPARWLIGAGRAGARPAG